MSALDVVVAYISNSATVSKQLDVICAHSTEEECRDLVSDAVKVCKEKKEAGKTGAFQGDCDKQMKMAVAEHCVRNEFSPACEWNMATTPINKLYFIIGGVAGIIVFLAIGIAIFCCCRRKKTSGGQAPGSGTTINSGTATGTETGATPMNPAAPTAAVNTQNRY